MICLNRHTQVKVYPFGGAVSCCETWWTQSRMRTSLRSNHLKHRAEWRDPSTELSGGISGILSSCAAS